MKAWLLWRSLWGTDFWALCSHMASTAIACFVFMATMASCPFTNPVFSLSPFINLLPHIPFKYSFVLVNPFPRRLEVLRSDRKAAHRAQDTPLPFVLHEKALEGQQPQQCCAVFIVSGWQRLYCSSNVRDTEHGRGFWTLPTYLTCFLYGGRGSVRPQIPL